MATDRRVLMVGAFAAIYLIWGSTFIAIKFALEAFPPFMLGATRFLVAGVAMYVWALRRTPQRPVRPTRSEWRVAFLGGGLMFVGGNGTAMLAVQVIDSGLAALLTASVPLSMAMLDRWHSHQRLAPGTVAGLLLGFAGVSVLVGPSGASGFAHLGASLLIVAGSFSWAAGSLYARGAPRPRGLLISSAMQMLAASAVFLVLSAVMGEFGRVDASVFGLRPLLGAAYLVVFGSVVAFGAYSWLMRSISLTLVTTHAYVNPAVALLLGWIVLGERLSGMTFVASAAIISSVFLIIASQTHGRAARPEGTGLAHRVRRVVVPVSGTLALPFGAAMHGVQRATGRPAGRPRTSRAGAGRRVRPWLARHPHRAARSPSSGAGATGAFTGMPTDAGTAGIPPR